MKPPVRCIINDRDVETLLPTGSVVLDFLRKQLKLTGTKEGCKEGECGACTVLIGRLSANDVETVEYKAVASCLLPLGELDGKHLVTIEGLNLPNSKLNPIQQALVDEHATQCGFCTPGIVMSLTGFFLSGTTLDYHEAIDALDGNICRCTGYVSIQRAVQTLCNTLSPQLSNLNGRERIKKLVELSVLPDYFLDIATCLGQLDESSLRQVRTLSKELSIGSPRRGADTSQNFFIDSPGSKKTIVAGGTDLYIQQPDELYKKDLELISGHTELSGITRKDQWLYIGAGTTVEELKRSPLVNEIFPGMKDYLYLVSSTIMRNRATLAGNIVNASPIGDLTIILLALKADLTLVKGSQTRLIPLKDFFKGYKKLDMKKGEIIKRIEVPIPFAGIDSRFHFEKVSRRKYLDIASCNSAIYLELDGNVISDIHISAGGVAPIPLYLSETCAWLRNKEVTAANIQEAVKIMEREISPISDVRGSTQYKTLLLRNLIFAQFITLFPFVAQDLSGQLKAL